MNSEPRMLIEIAIEPRTKADQTKLGQALLWIATNDPDCQFSVDHESGQTIISGSSEAHLERVLGRLKDELKIGVTAGSPQVAYRETISRVADIDYTHKKQAGDWGQFARVKIRFEPLPPGSGYRFENELSGTVSKEYISGVKKGLKGSIESGVLGGFPVIDFKAVLRDVAYHDVDSSALAFEIASMQKAGPVLLEPVMRVEVVTPRDCMSDVIGDLNCRRGQITGQDQRGNAEVISALVPLANLFGYPKTLESMTHGRATHEMRFSHYAPVPMPVPDDPTFRPAIGMRA